MHKTGVGHLQVARWTTRWPTWWKTEPTLLMWPWWVKIPTADFTDVTLYIGDDVRGGDGYGILQGDRWGGRHDGGDGYKQGGEMVTLVKIVWFIDESRKYAIVIKEKKCCLEEVIKEVEVVKEMKMKVRIVTTVKIVKEVMACDVSPVAMFRYYRC